MNKETPNLVGQTNVPIKEQPKEQQIVTKPKQSNLQVGNYNFIDFEKDYGDAVIKLLGEKYGISKNEFFVSVANVVKKSERLRQCSITSVIGAFLTCAEIGLKPNTFDGHCYVLPYKQDATFVLGYKGAIELAMRNPRVQRITAEVVFEDEYESGKFREVLGTNPGLYHEPIRNREKESRLYGAYATCQLAGSNHPVWVFVDAKQLKKIEGMSQGAASNFSPYKNGTDVLYWMQKKAAIKQLIKLLPKSNNEELAKAIYADDMLGIGGKFHKNSEGFYEIKEPNAPITQKLNNAFGDENEQDFPPYEDGSTV